MHKNVYLRYVFLFSVYCVETDLIKNKIIPEVNFLNRPKYLNVIEEEEELRSQLNVIEGLGSNTHHEQALNVAT